MKHFSICGTCVCRDILGFHLRVQEYEVDSFVQSINPIALTSRPFSSVDDFEKEVDEITEMSNFLKKCIKLDYNGRGTFAMY